MSISAADLQRQHQAALGGQSSSAAQPQAQAPMADPFPSLGGGDADASGTGYSSTWGPAPVDSSSHGPGAIGTPLTASSTSSNGAANGAAATRKQAQPDL